MVKTVVVDEGCAKCTDAPVCIFPICATDKRGEVQYYCSCCDLYYDCSELCSGFDSHFRQASWWLVEEEVCRASSDCVHK